MTTPPPTVIWPGQVVTADRLNAGFLLGTLVFAAYRDASQDLSALQTVGLASDALAWDNVPLDLLSGWSASQPSRYTPPIAGRYLVSGGVGFQRPSSGTGDAGGNQRGCTWRQNGAVVPAGTSRIIATAWPTGDTQDLPVVTANTLSIVFNGTTDYVELCPFQDTNTTLGTATGSNRPFVTITYVGSD